MEAYQLYAVLDIELISYLYWIEWWRDGSLSIYEYTELNNFVSKWIMNT